MRTSGTCCLCRLLTADAAGAHMLLLRREAFLLLAAQCRHHTVKEAIYLVAGLVI
jgi:hypothetical protein